MKTLAALLGLVLLLALAVPAWAQSISGCGRGSVRVGTDQAGEVRLGLLGDALVNGCVLTFGAPRGVAPACSVKLVDDGFINPLVVGVATTTTLTFWFVPAVHTGRVLYICP